MDENTKQMLFAWGQLYRQCEEVEMKLNERGSDTGAVEAELVELRKRTEAAFQDAYQSLKREDAGAARAGRVS